MKRITVINLFLIMAVLHEPLEAAVLPEAVSDAEMSRLPQYCVARMKMPQNSAEARAWRAQIGVNFLDIHHYCAGLNFINRYWAARTTRERNYYLQRADANFSYVVSAIKPDFTMGAELFTSRGEVYKFMRKTGDAIKDLRQAISIDPKFVKAYLQLADVYVGIKDRSGALDAISDGLRHAPESTALQRRYLELGGKDPFPEPIIGKVTEQAQEPEASADSTPVPASVEAVPQPAVETEVAPVIGTPKNPYCRFCPPE